MLNKLIKEYIGIRVSYEAACQDGSIESMSALNKIANYLSHNNCKCDPNSIDNKLWAMLAFFDMFTNKIAEGSSALMCYYFSTLVSKDRTLPQNLQLEGIKYRAFITYKNLSKWENIFNAILNTSCIVEYKGNLDESTFMDVLLLGDVYKVWDFDPTNQMLTNLKSQAPIVASNHPYFTKQQFIRESELAHDALLGMIETLVVKTKF